MIARPGRFLALAAWLLATPAIAAPLPSAAAARLSPRLWRAATTGDTARVTVWLEFADKGERGPDDLATRLARAERELTPRTLARRTRAHVSPLVDYRDLPLEQAYLDALAAQGIETFGASRWFNRVAVRARGEQLASLAGLSFVQAVEPVERARPSPEPTDDRTEVVVPRSRSFSASGSISYGMTDAQVRQMNVPAVHDSGYTGAGVLVCVLDDGFNSYDVHEATSTLPVGNRVRDFVEGDTDVQDLVGPLNHGQWTLSTLGGFVPGTYVGPAFGASFALGRTENSYSEKPIEMVWWGMGAEWADSLGADIISSSLGYNTFPDSAGTDLTYEMMDGHTSTISRAVEIAASKGILVVSSAGNSGADPGWGYKILAPADVNGDSMLAVGAVDLSGVRASFSSKGPTADGRIKPDLSALGVSAWVASASGTPDAYLQLSGTSFSCPLVAGLAACLMQARPTWTPKMVIEALKETASRATHPDTLLGWGIPNGLGALRWQPDTVGTPPGTVASPLALLGPNPLVADGPPARLRIAALADGSAHRASLRVFDAQGRLVRTLWTGVLASGQSQVIAWDARDDAGGVVRSGLYFVAFDDGPRRSALRLAAIR